MLCRTFWSPAVRHFFSVDNWQMLHPAGQNVWQSQSPLSDISRTLLDKSGIISRALHLLRQQEIGVCYNWFRIWEKGTNVLGKKGKIRKIQFTTTWMSSKQPWKTIYFRKGKVLLISKIYSFSWLPWRHSSFPNTESYIRTLSISNFTD